MTTKVAIDCTNHINLVVEDAEQCINHFQTIFDAEYARKLPPAPAFQAGLFAMGGGLFEYFAPAAWLLSARYGPFHLGIEYQANMERTRQALAERNIRIIRDIGVAIHTHPDDTLGVSFEFYGENFKQREWEDIGRLVRPVEYWRDEHPMGMSGLCGFSMVVENLDAAVGQLTDLFSCEVTDESNRPALNARMKTLKFVDTCIEVLAPSCEGEVSRYLARYGQGMRSSVFSVEDGAKAEAFLESRKVEYTRDPNDGRLTVPASANAGVIFEFVPGN